MRGGVVLAAGALMLGSAMAAPDAAADDDPWAGITWTTPQPVSPAGVDVDRGSVWQLADGSRLALWSVADDPSTAGDGPAQVWTSTQAAGGGGAWSVPVTVSDFQQFFTAYPNFVWTADPSGAAVVAWTQWDDATDQWTYRATTRSAAGVWSTPATVGGKGGVVGTISVAGSKAVAVAPDGRATLVFVAKEAAASPGESSTDNEVFRTAWTGSAWSTATEVSVETPSTPIVCAEPDPDECPDREGGSSSPAVAYDGSGQEWIAWIHAEAADEAAEDAGVFLRGTTTTQLATGSESEARDFAIAGISGDPSGGVALAWSRVRAGVDGTEVWAHAGGTVDGATGLLTPAATDADLRSIAMVGDRAIAVVAAPPSGIDGSRRLLAAVRTPGAATWSAATPVTVHGEDVVGTSGRAVLTTAGVPVIGYTTASSDQARALAPAGTGWTASTMSAGLALSGSGTVLHSFAITPTGSLLAAWLTEDDGVDRLHVASSTGLPDGTVVTPAPPPAPTLVAPTTRAITLAGGQVVRWGTATTATSYDARYRSARWDGGFGSYAYPASWQRRATTSVSLTLTRGRTYCVSVRARNAGGTSAWSAERCVTAPLDQTALKRSSGWTLSKRTAYFGGSAVTTRRHGATLRRSGARLRQVGVVATTCPACGKVSVFLGSRRIGRLDLGRGAVTRNRQVLMLPTFALRSGTVRVVVASKGRPVRIDGLVVRP